MSTTTSSSPAATTTGNDGSQSIIAASGSTLILIFIALGLFLGGLIVLFSMRRYMSHYSRRVYQRQMGARRWEAYGPSGVFYAGLPGVQVVRHMKDFGSKPELWDFEIERAKGDRLEDVLPISAFKSKRYEDCVGSGSSMHASHGVMSPHLSTPPNHRPRRPRPLFYDHLQPFRVGLRDTSSIIRSFRPSRRSRSPPPPSTPPMETTADSTDAEGIRMAAHSEKSPPVQVVLAISMPARHQQVGEMGLPLYALGITEVSWSGEPLMDFA